MYIKINNLKMHKFLTDFNYIWLSFVFFIVQSNIRKSFSLTFFFFFLSIFWELNIKIGRCLWHSILKFKWYSIDSCSSKFKSMIKYNVTQTKNDLNGIIYKLDIEKAYDHVNWAYLLEILDKMGFGKKMDQLNQLVSIVRFLVLVNETCTSFFKVLGV